MKTSMLVAMLAFATFSGSPASAEGDGTAALPCNALCRQWMGTDGPSPATQEAPAPREAMPAQPLDLNGSTAPAANPSLATTVAAPVVKRARSAKTIAVPRRLSAQLRPAAILPPPRPRFFADATPTASAPVPPNAATVAAVAPATEAAKSPLSTDAEATSQVIAMLAPPALPADPIVIGPSQAPAMPAIVAPAPMVSTPMPAVLPVVAAQPILPAPTVLPASTKTSRPLMPPAFDVIAALLLVGPTQP